MELNIIRKKDQTKVEEGSLTYKILKLLFCITWIVYALRVIRRELTQIGKSD